MSIVATKLTETRSDGQYEELQPNALGRIHFSSRLSSSSVL